MPKSTKFASRSPHTQFLHTSPTSPGREQRQDSSKAPTFPPCSTLCRGWYPSQSRARTFVSFRQDTRQGIARPVSVTVTFRWTRNWLGTSPRTGAKVVFENALESSPFAIILNGGLRILTTHILLGSGPALKMKMLRKFSDLLLHFGQTEDEISDEEPCCTGICRVVEYTVKVESAAIHHSCFDML